MTNSTLLLSAAMADAIANKPVDELAKTAGQLTSDVFLAHYPFVGHGRTYTPSFLGEDAATYLVAAADELAKHPAHVETALRGYEVAVLPLTKTTETMPLAERAARSWATHVGAKSEDSQRICLSELRYYFSRAHSNFLEEKLATANAAKAETPAPDGGAAAPA